MMHIWTAFQFAIRPGLLGVRRPTVKVAIAQTEPTSRTTRVSVEFRLESLKSVVQPRCCRNNRLLPNTRPDCTLALFQLLEPMTADP
jgi:hypothetical protein